jgi:hypothetical protein
MDVINPCIIGLFECLTKGSDVVSRDKGGRFIYYAGFGGKQINLSPLFLNVSSQHHALQADLSVAQQIAQQIEHSK